MKITRRNITDLPYSMHDMRVTAMEYGEDTLTLRFQYGIVSCAPPYEQVSASVRFPGVDWDFCFAYVLNICANEGEFTGSKLPLKKFIGGFHNMSFEIVDECYGYNKSRFAGYLSIGDGLKECIIELYHLGDMEYIIENG